MSLMLTGIQNIFNSRKNVVHSPYSFNFYNTSSIGVRIMVRRIKIATIYLLCAKPYAKYFTQVILFNLYSKLRYLSLYFHEEIEAAEC